MSKKIKGKNSSGFSTGSSDPTDACGDSAHGSGFSVEGGNGGCHSINQSEGSGFVSESNPSGFESTPDFSNDSGFGSDYDETLVDSDGKKQLFVNVKPLTSQGGMSQVLRAKWLCNGHEDGATHEVVIKRLPQEHHRKSPQYKFFKNEFYIAKLITSPHVIKVLGEGEDDTGCYYWMDFCNGLPLHDLLTKAPFSDSEAQLIGAGILKGLNALHVEGVCHRDLKPENILIKGSGNFVVLIDLGLATRENIHDIEGLRNIGTMKYAAPEQRDGRIHLIDNRSDLYSFGLILLEMLIGSKGDPSLASQLKQPYRDIVQKCLSTDPNDRYASAEEILTIFQNRTPNQSDIDEIEKLIKDYFFDDLKLDDGERTKIRARAIDLGIGEERFEELISHVSIKVQELNEEITESALKGVTPNLKLLANNNGITEEKYLFFISIRKHDINKLTCEDIFNYFKGVKSDDDLAAIKEKAARLYINDGQFNEIVEKIQLRQQREETAKIYRGKAIKIFTDVFSSIATHAARGKKIIIIIALLVICSVVGYKYFPGKTFAPTPPVVGPIEQFKATANINIRVSPTTSSNTIGTAYLGKLLRVTERNGKWLHLEEGGWVHADYVQTFDPNAPKQAPVEIEKVIKKPLPTVKPKEEIAPRSNQPAETTATISVDTINLPNGNRYEGENRGGVPHGVGTLFFADGTRYKGRFENGMKIPGEGKLYMQ